MSCKLALLPWLRKGRCTTGAVAGPRPSLGTSLPSDMIDSDRPWPAAGFTAPLGVLATTGALCKPPLEGAETTLSESAGLWPRTGCPLLVVLATDGVLLIDALPCAIDDLLLCAIEGACPGLLSRGYPLDDGTRSSSLRS